VCQEIWSWVLLLTAVALLLIIDPRLAFAGAVGLLSGNWGRWNRRMGRVLEDGAWVW